MMMKQVILWKFIQNIYPKEIHDLHKDYPLALEIMNMYENMLSQVQKDIYKDYYGKEATDEKTNKLVLNVMDKKKYVLHISAFKSATWSGRSKLLHREAHTAHVPGPNAPNAGVCQDRLSRDL